MNQYNNTVVRRYLILTRVANLTGKFQIIEKDPVNGMIGYKVYPMRAITMQH
jgi:hypothetical protein